MISVRRALGALALLCAAACAKPAAPAPAADDAHRRLPTGARLDPAGTSVDAGNFPLALALSPSRDDAVLLLDGFHERALQVIDRQSGRITRTIPLPSAFLGLAFSPDGRRIAASGGNADAIYLFSWSDGAPLLADSILLSARRPSDHSRYPAGLAWSRDGALLYVAENLTDSLAVIDVGQRRVLQRFATERYPYGVAVGADGAVYVSAWGGHTVSKFIEAGGGALAPQGRIVVGRHPSAMTLSADGARLFVASATTDRIAVVDTRRRAVIAELRDPPPAGPDEGSTPDAVALSSDGTRLFVAEADANAVAVFDLSAATSGVSAARGHDALIARIPVGWYPAALAAFGDTLVVVNAKGRGTGPNPGDPTPVSPSGATTHPYTLGMLQGTVTTFAGARWDSLALSPFAARVARANGWSDTARAAGKYPPFEHVIYVMKENRTFDQVLSDLPGADGDTSLQFFRADASPNHHALARRFGAYDRFFVNAEVSADGHNWSDAAYAADYVEKTMAMQYADQGRDYDYDGTNRDTIADDDVNEPASGYLWDLAARAHITYRDYGELTEYDTTVHPDTWRGTKPALMGHLDGAYPGWDLAIRDQRRMDEWLREFRAFEADGGFPALTTIWLPNDHTSGLRAGAPSPRAQFADNDLALGRLVEAVSRSKYWRSTIIFVLEDDAQNGADHVDSHRSLLFAICAYCRPGVVHRFINTSDVIATIADILHLGSLSHFDYYGRTLRGIYADSADLTPYVALIPAVSLDDKNPPRPRGTASRGSRPLDLTGPDRADERALNLELWRALKGDRPYPSARPAPSAVAATEH